jgi:MoaA/NifB/PqqE/SkfB family radical SAM enzyme
MPTISHVLLFLTYRCNLRCDFCLSFNGYWRADLSLPFPATVEPQQFIKPARPYREMTTADVVERVIPQCEKNGVKGIALSGGEILVRKDVAEIFRALGASTVKWCMDSNLMICNEGMARTIVDSRCDAVFVSLDGVGAVHDQLRCNPKAFERATRGLRCLLAARQAASAPRTTIIINFVLQKGNEAELPKVVALAGNYGVDGVSVQLLSERQYHTTIDAETAADSLRIGSAIAAELGLPISTYPAPLSTADELRAWFSSPLTDRFYGGCSYIHHTLRIDPEGNVIPCLEHRMGNILEQELAEIWDGDLYRAFRAHIVRSPVEACLRCCNMDARRPAAVGNERVAVSAG